MLAIVSTPEGVGSLTPERVGLLPWQALEVFNRLKSSFREYHILSDEFAGQNFQIFNR
jgi:hypothetical protein